MATLRAAAWRLRVDSAASGAASSTVDKDHLPLDRHYLTRNPSRMPSLSSAVWSAARRSAPPLLSVRVGRKHKGFNGTHKAVGNKQTAAYGRRDLKADG